MGTGSIKNLALMRVVLSSCNHPSGTQVTEARLVPAAQFNGSAAIACSDFRKIVNEVSKGLLTNSELQQRIGSVYDHARLATLNSGSPIKFEFRPRTSRKRHFSK